MPIARIEMKWYAVAVANTKERSIKKELVRQSRIRGIEDQVGEVLVPTMPVEQVKKGKRVTENRKMYDGYLICRLALTDSVYYLFHETPGVITFLPSSKDPLPLTEEEVERIQNGSQMPVKVRVDYSVGDRVEVVFGPFTGSEGKVREVQEENPGEVTVVVGLKLWGRDVDVPLNWSDLRPA